MGYSGLGDDDGQGKHPPIPFREWSDPQRRQIIRERKKGFKKGRSKRVMRRSSDEIKDSKEWLLKKERGLGAPRLDRGGYDRITLSLKQ